MKLERAGWVYILLIMAWGWVMHGPPKKNTSHTHCIYEKVMRLFGGHTHFHQLTYVCVEFLHSIITTCCVVLQQQEVPCAELAQPAPDTCLWMSQSIVGSTSKYWFTGRWLEVLLWCINLRSGLISGLWPWQHTNHKLFFPVLAIPPLSL